MDISMDIHGKSVDMDMNMDGKFHIHGKPEQKNIIDCDQSNVLSRALFSPIFF